MEALALIAPFIVGLLLAALGVDFTDGKFYEKDKD